VHTDDVLRESTTEITAGNSSYMFQPHDLLNNFCVVSNGERRDRHYRPFVGIAGNIS